jgi:hypothetical protein
VKAGQEAKVVLAKPLISNHKLKRTIEAVL